MFVSKHNFLVLYLILIIVLPATAQRTLTFSGMNWIVRNGSGGPGPNLWSDDPESAWVDSSGFLHLKVRKIGGTWHSAEIYTDKSYGYGEYWFEVMTDVEKLDPNLVTGLFTYENDSREIDIEFSRWSDPDTKAGWYTLQPPPYTTANQDNFELGLNGSSSTHSFIWSPDSISFKSTKPYSLILPPQDSLIREWTYKGNSNPPAGKERLHINFWLFQGQAPVNQEEAELVISRVLVQGANSMKESERSALAFDLFRDSRNHCLRVKMQNNRRVNQIRLLDLSGRQVYFQQTEAPDATIDTSGIPAGIYLLKVSSGRQTASVKMILE